MPELIRPLVIMVLVLTEVGLWQWRIILTARGALLHPVLLGMLGAVLQITAIAQVVANVHDPLTVAAYAAGVGGGILAGVVVGTRVSSSALGIQVITANVGLEAQLRSRGWPVTSHHGRGDAGPVEVLLVVINGRCRAALLDDLGELAPDAFWTVELLRPQALINSDLAASCPTPHRSPSRRSP